MPVFPLEAPIVTDKRVKRMVYNENEIFELKCHYNYQSFIELPKNETIKRIAMGDSGSWRVVPSGNKIYIRPLESGVRTNMVVDTNRLSYTFDLIALMLDNPDDVTYTLRFYYPGASDGFEKDNSVELLEDKVKGSIGKGKINHDYSFSGDTELMPSDMFDNGQVTFFQFNAMTPKVFAVKEDRSEYAMEMISYEGFVIIDGLHSELSLRYKDKKLTIFKDR